MKSLIAFLIFVAAMASQPLAAAEVRVLAIVIFKTSMPELTAAYERKTGHVVKATVLPPVGLKTAFQESDAFDAVVTIVPTMNEFAASGSLATDTRRTVARSGIGVAVRAGAEIPEISTPDTFIAMLRKSQSIGYSTGPSGMYVEQMLQRSGIENFGGTKFVKVTREPVAAPLSRGDIAVGLQQLSELIGQPGIAVIGPLPSALQHHTIADGAVSLKAKQPREALDFLDFLRSAEALAILKKAGVDGP
ncbi:MAG: molybdate ABC transporter substrate-binding protein [Beijerinckiaceae bacterium]